MYIYPQSHETQSIKELLVAEFQNDSAISIMISYTEGVKGIDTIMTPISIQ